MGCRNLIGSWLLLLLVGCEEPAGSYTPRISVEGWVEAGRSVRVVLTHNRPPEGVYTETELEDAVIRWAKVTVSDGERSEILTLTRDENLPVKFYYRSLELLGKTGSRYTLTVEYGGVTATAETTIPEAVPLEAVVPSPVPGNDTLYTVQMRFRDPPGKQYYKLYTRLKGKDRNWIPSFSGNYDDGIFGKEEVTLTVNRGRQSYANETENFFQEQFSTKDTLQIRFCTQPREGFDFWTSYENEAINGGNPFFPANTNLKSNVANGLGVWCGYGVCEYEVRYP